MLSACAKSGPLPWCVALQLHSELVLNLSKRCQKIDSQMISTRPQRGLQSPLAALLVSRCLLGLQALAAYQRVHSAYPHNLECLAQLKEICTNLGDPAAHFQFYRCCLHGNSSALSALTMLLQHETSIGPCGLATCRYA